MFLRGASLTVYILTAGCTLAAWLNLVITEEPALEVPFRCATRLR